MAEQKVRRQFDRTELISFSAWKAIAYLESSTDYREFLPAHEEPSVNVWSSIRYLDSPTDYREYLLPSIRQICGTDTDLVVVDDAAKLSWWTLGLIAIVAMLICLGVLLILRI